MSRLTAALLSHLLVVSAAGAQTPATLDSIDRYVRTEVTRYRIPGLSLAVLRGDSVVLARGYGYANVEHRVPATDSTVYQSGSVGKQFTAAAIVMLAEQGRLSLDDSITRFPRTARRRGAASRSGISSPTPPRSPTTPIARWTRAGITRKPSWCGSRPSSPSSSHRATAGITATPATSCWGSSSTA